jgi:hypothetical protein
VTVVNSIDNRNAVLIEIVAELSREGMNDKIFGLALDDHPPPREENLAPDAAGKKFQGLSAHHPPRKEAIGP